MKVDISSLSLDRALSIALNAENETGAVYKK